MKKLFLILFLNVTLFPLWAQGGSDSLRYSQENGTLEKQRFIDQYDYVFMTKEPTKWMLKVMSQPFYSPTNNLFSRFRPAALSPFWLNFERKITPSFSVQLGATYFIRMSSITSIDGKSVSALPYYDFDNANRRTTLGDVGIFFGSVEGRWYYNLAKRVKEGKSANNFSGNYFGFRLEKAFNPNLSQNSTELTSANGKYNTDYVFEQFNQRLTLAYGIQRRFLGHGLIDFGLQLSQSSFQEVGNQLTFLDGDNSVFDRNNPKPNFWGNIQNNWSDLGKRREWQLRTELRFGMAIGDFKKTKKRPLCDVLKCYEEQQSLWKFSWPQITLGPREQSLVSSIAYERRIGNSAFSINTQLDFQLMHGAYQNVFYQGASGNLNLSKVYLLASIQPRFYFTQSRRIKQYGTGHNLSGWYVAGSVNVIIENDVVAFNNSTSQKFQFNRFGLKPALGFQQQLFQNGYVDFSVSPLWAGKGNNPINNIFGANLKLGFAF